MSQPDLDALRRASESLLPGDDSLSAAEVQQLLRQVGSDPEALAANAEALALAAAVQPLRACGDFQGLFTAARARRLSPERRLLLDDHLHSCVACRRLWSAAPAAAPAAPASAASPPRRVAARRHWQPWAYAAAALAALVIGFAAGRAGLLPGQSDALATVTGGGVYAVGAAQVRPVDAGYVLRAGGELRAGNHAGAAVRLRDGSQLELGPRADFTLTRGWSGTTVHLLQGQLIVRAAHQAWGRHLYVATADSRAAVKGTIFSMSHGLLGSRLAVLQGSVAFDYSRDGRSRRQLVVAGHEASSTPLLTAVPIADEIAWSQNAGQYLAMLGELQSIGKQLDAITPAPARFQSVLVNAVPASTAVYAAIPNLGDTVSQFDQILQSNLAQSPALAAWLRQPSSSAAGAPTRGASLQTALSQVQQANSYLGNEIVAAMVPGRSGGLVVLAEQSKPGLATFLTTPGPDGKAMPVKILSDPAAAGTARSRSLLVWIGAGSAGQVMVASRNGLLLQQAAALAQSSAPGPFLQTGLYQQIAPVYQQGASWIIAADVNRLHASNVLHPVLGNSTASQPEYLVAQSKAANGGHASDLRLTFSGPRQGAAALLGAPGPNGGLAFISPAATVAASLITENPSAFLATVKLHAGASASQQQLTADLTNLAAPLGGEFTIAQDGPVLPTPSWKLVVEVNDSVAMQNAIQQFVQDAAQHQPSGQSLTLAAQTISGQSFYIVQKGGAAALAYTFAGTYLVVASSLAEVQSALQTEQNGTGLPSSSIFQQLLPSDGRTNFSAVLYHNLNPSLAPLAQKIGASAPAQWKSEIASLFSNPVPGLVYAYGQPDQIELASGQSVLSMALDDLLLLRAQASHGDHGHP